MILMLLKAVGVLERREMGTWDAFAEELGVVWVLGYTVFVCVLVFTQGINELEKILQIVHLT